MASLNTNSVESLSLTMYMSTLYPSGVALGSLTICLKKNIKLVGTYHLSQIKLWVTTITLSKLLVIKYEYSAKFSSIPIQRKFIQC